MKTLPGASSLDRAKKCAASYALPQASRESFAGEKGDLLHEYLLAKKEDRNLEKVPDNLRSLCEMVNLDEIPNGDYEVGLALDVTTGIARYNGPKDEVGDNEIVGRADIVGKTAEGHVYVGDLKTGLALYVPPADRNLQIGFAALCLSKLMKVPTAFVEILRLRDNGSFERDHAVLSDWSLLGIEAQLADIAREVRKAQALVRDGKQPALRQGPHCEYCNAFHACPAKVALAVAVTQDPASIEKAVMTALTPETAGVAYYKWREAQNVLSRIREGINGYARQNPIDLGNGLVLGPVRVTSPRINGDKAFAILKGTVGPITAETACHMSTSKVAIKNALRPVVPRGSLRRVSDVVFSDLEKAGAMTVTVREDVKPHRAGRSTEEDDS